MAKTKTEKVYRVRHAFGHDGVWYTRRNEEKVADLPKDVREAKVEKGLVEVLERPVEDAPPAKAEAKKTEK